jgi:4-amino-4-deoxy-L-arabinose transferase
MKDIIDIEEKPKVTDRAVKKLLVLFCACYALLYILPLGIRPIVIPDESRYAEISREMLETGDWIVPRINGLRYFEKPVLGYWLNAAAIALFGENGFSIRLPSALAVGISALLIFLLVRKFGSGDFAALVTAAAFLSCFEVFGVGIFCVLDSIFSMFVTAAIVFFFFAWKENKSHKKNLFLALAGICCGLAFLTKGFIAVVLPLTVTVPFLLWQRKWNDLLKIWWLPLAAAVAVSLPWCLAVYLKEPDFWRYFFWHEHIQRFLNPQFAQHLKPLWYFLPAILAGALPWTSLLPNAFTGLKNLQLKDTFIRFSICWLLFPFVFFSFSRGKLATYILPCFPPLVILIMTGFLRWYSLPGSEKKFTKNLRVSSIIMVIAAIALFFAQASSFACLKIYQPNEKWKWMLLVIAFLAYAALLLFAACRKDFSKRLTCCLLAPLAVLFSAHFVIPNQFGNGKMPGDFLLQNSNRIQPDSIIVSDKFLTPAVCWFYKRDNVYLLGTAGELDYGLTFEDAKNRWSNPADFQDFIDHYACGKTVVLIADEERFDEYKNELPTPSFSRISNGFLFAEFNTNRKHIEPAR